MPTASRLKELAKVELNNIGMNISQKTNKLCLTSPFVIK